MALLLLIVVGLATGTPFVAAQQSTPPNTNTGAGGCTNNAWPSELNTNYAGGQSNAAATVDDCKAVCIASTTCVGIDFNPAGGTNLVCWLLNNLNGQKFTGASSGITHYNLTRCSTTGGSCSYSWTTELNTNYGGGSSNSATTQPDCRTACINQQTCVGIDWNPTGGTPGNQFCWILTSLTGQKFSGTNSGITHENLTRSCTGGGATTPSVCVNAWSPELGVNYAGGSANTAATTIDACYAACVAQTTCIAIDFNNADTTKCYLLTTLTGQKFTNNAINHYNLTRCGGGTTATQQPPPGTTYFILLNKFVQGAITVDPITYELETTFDINSATWFTQYQCLGASIPGFNATSSCYSLSTADKPQWYVRNQWGVATLQARTPQYYAARYAEDASINITQNTFYTGYATLQPVVYDTSPYYYAVDVAHSRVETFIQGQVASFNDVASFYMYQVTQSSSPVTATCRYTWTRINKAQTHGYYGIALGGTTSQYCRQKCLVYPDCIGIYYKPSGSSGLCYLVTRTTADQRLIADADYIFYELTRTFPGQCSHGCISAWTPYTFDINQFRAEWNQNRTTYDCGRTCVTNNCLGFAWSALDAVTSNCSLYYSDQGVGFANATAVPLVVIIPVTANCDCAPSLELWQGYRDQNAVQQTSVSGLSNCETACINNRLCRGFDLRDVANNCYLSLASPPSLVATTTANYHDLTRSPCGNGCQDKWQFFRHTMMTSNSTANAATSEHDCRKACQATSGCTAIDWNYNTNSCLLGTSSSVLGVEGSIRGWNHFDLTRQPYCE